MEIVIVRHAEAGIWLRVVRIELDRSRHERDNLIEYLAIPFPTKH